MPLTEKIASLAFMAWYAVPVEPTHFYSPLPDVSSLKRRSRRWFRQGDFSHVSIDVAAQRSLLKQLTAFSHELPNLPSFSQITSDGFGLGYGEIEASFLHCMIRHYKPRRMIEIGSGISTRFALHALQLNRDANAVPFELDCVEPYPRPKLKELADSGQIRLRAREVQDVGLDHFRALQEGDFLFIDSSHAGKLDSDVYYLYLEVLPKLNRGVIVHIHDIMFPYLALSPSHPLADLSMLWNESAIVKAFLTFNDAFQVLMCQSHLHYNCPEALQEVVAAYDPAQHFPSSLWLQKSR